MYVFGILEHLKQVPEKSMAYPLSLKKEDPFLQSDTEVSVEVWCSLLGLCKVSGYLRIKSFETRICVKKHETRGEKAQSI